jgi:hypothetical protein
MPAVADGALENPEARNPQPGIEPPFQMNGFKGIPKVNWLW